MQYLSLFVLLFIWNCESYEECNWNYGVPGDINVVMDDNDRRQMIVDGDEASTAEYPWHVQLSMGCAGAIIGKEWVITAAHCIDGIVYQDVGEWQNCDVMLDNDHDNWIRPVEVIIHPGFGIDLLNDIALIRLPEDAIHCDDIESLGAIQLLEPGYQFNNCTGFIAGRGTQWSGGPVSWPYLLELVTTVYNHETCNMGRLINELGEFYAIENSQICAYTPQDYTEDTCQGDSGGWVAIDVDDGYESHHYVALGIVSYGVGCGVHPGIYTLIPAHKQWVLDHFPDAPFFSPAGECDRQHYNEGPDPWYDDDLPFMPHPLPNDTNVDLSDCELTYAGQTGYGASPHCNNENCKVCDQAMFCYFCKEGFEVDTPSEDDPRMDCSGTCVPSGTAENPQGYHNSYCQNYHPCLPEEQGWQPSLWEVCESDCIYEEYDENTDCDDICEECWDHPSCVYDDGSHLLEDSVLACQDNLCGTGYYGGYGEDECMMCFTAYPDMDDCFEMCDACWGICEDVDGEYDFIFGDSPDECAENLCGDDGGYEEDECMMCVDVYSVMGTCYEMCDGCWGICQDHVDVGHYFGDSPDECAENVCDNSYGYDGGYEEDECMMCVGAYSVMGTCFEMCDGCWDICEDGDLGHYFGDSPDECAENVCGDYDYDYGPDSGSGDGCDAHSHCPSNLPFCYEGNCVPCDECHYCDNGIDGTCGSCDTAIYPLYEDECPVYCKCPWANGWIEDYVCDWGAMDCIECPYMWSGGTVDVGVFDGGDCEGPNGECQKCGNIHYANDYDYDEYDGESVIIHHVYNCYEFCESCWDLCEDVDYVDYAMGESVDDCKENMCAPCDCEVHGVSFCNFDYGYHGSCEMCSDFHSVAECYDIGLPYAGAQDCEFRCFGSQWVLAFDEQEVPFDLNDDGEVNIVDVMHLINVILELEEDAYEA